MSAFQGYPPDTLKFLRALKRNNDRDWFNKNKSRYEAAVLEPSLAFIADLSTSMKAIAPRFQAIPKKSGGSLMRIYRDTRFSKDKSPYKTNIGMHVRHEVGKDVHAPGFYIHVEPKSIFLGVGLWKPEPRVARQIREAIVENPGAWKRATRGKPFNSLLELTGESLKRPPRDFDPEHPLVADLQRKDFIAARELDDSVINDAGFLKETVATFRKARPMMKFLCEAIGLPY